MVGILCKGTGNWQNLYTISEFCTSEWPRRNKLSKELKQYWSYQGNLTLNNGLLLYQAWILIPSHSRQKTQQKIHNGHQGVQRCKFYVFSSVWWPGITGTIEQFIQLCLTCQKLTIPHLLPTLLPTYPEKVAADLFEFKQTAYLLVVDYYWIQIFWSAKINVYHFIQCHSTLKAMFARFGIPANLISDNGPQFD